MTGMESQPKDGAATVMRDPLYTIVDWDQHFETHKTRPLLVLRWIQMPLKRGDGYCELVEGRHGSAHFGAWCALVQVAATCKVRGVLVRNSGEPHTAKSLSVLTHLPVASFKAMFQRAESIGWLSLTRHPSAGKVPEKRQPTAGSLTPLSGMEGNGREGKDPPTPLPANLAGGSRAFWAVYPVKIKQADVDREFAEAIKCGADPDEIIDAAREFAESPAGKAGKFVQHPAKWLVGRRWADDRVAWWTHDMEGEAKTAAAEKYKRRCEIEKRIADLPGSQWESLVARMDKHYRRGTGWIAETPWCVKQGLNRADFKSREAAWYFWRETRDQETGVVA